MKERIINEDFWSLFMECVTLVVNLFITKHVREGSMDSNRKHGHIVSFTRSSFIARWGTESGFLVNYNRNSLHYYILAGNICITRGDS